jgi:hypothetical protein
MLERQWGTFPKMELFYDGEEPPNALRVRGQQPSDEIVWVGGGKEARYLHKLPSFEQEPQGTTQSVIAHGAENGPPVGLRSDAYGRSVVPYAVLTND